MTTATALLDRHGLTISDVRQLPEFDLPLCLWHKPEPVRDKRLLAVLKHEWKTCAVCGMNQNPRIGIYVETHHWTNVRSDERTALIPLCKARWDAQRDCHSHVADMEAFILFARMVFEPESFDARRAQQLERHFLDEPIGFRVGQGFTLWHLKRARMTTERR